MLRYAGYGWPVFPVYPIRDGKCSCNRKAGCDRPGKHPMLNNGLRDATTNSASIRKWFNNVPDANVGVCTGDESSIWALDVDGPKGLAALASLEATYGALPRTMSVGTGGGGKHRYFNGIRNSEGPQRHQAGRPPPGNCRGDGGYVLVPPSNHVSGGGYVWQGDAMGFNEVPPWLLELVLTSKLPLNCLRCRHRQWRDDRARKADEGAGVPDRRSRPGGLRPGVGEGSRHSRALELVRAELGRGDDAAEIEALALEWALRCTPPMPHEEVLRIVADLASKERGKAAAEAEQADQSAPWGWYSGKFCCDIAAADRVVSFVARRPS